MTNDEAVNVLGHDQNSEAGAGLLPFDDACPAIDEGAILCCRACHNPIADRSELLSPSAGPRVFANPHGQVFEIWTLRGARGLALIGPATDEATWFPGFAWRIALCANCTLHLGWSFERTRPGLEPPLFFGLLRAELVELPSDATSSH